MSLSPPLGATLNLYVHEIADLNRVARATKSTPEKCRQPLLLSILESKRRSDMSEGHYSLAADARIGIRSGCVIKTGAKYTPD